MLYILNSNSRLLFENTGKALRKAAMRCRDKYLMERCLQVANTLSEMSSSGLAPARELEKVEEFGTEVRFRLEKALAGP